MRSRSRSRTTALGVLLCAGLTACTMGPNFEKPAPPETAKYLPDQTGEFVAGGIDGGEAQRIVEGLDIPGK